MQQIEIPESGERVVYVSPKEEVNLKGINPENIKIDVLGADFIITDVTTGARLVFPNLGLILFSEDDVPQFSFDGQVISTDVLLGDVGLIENISQDDLLSFTSLNTSPEQGTSADEMGTTAREEEVVAEMLEQNAAKVAEMEAILYDIAQFREPPGAQGQLDIGQKKFNDISDKTETETQRQLQIEKTKEEFKEPPEKKQSSTSTKQSDETDTSESDIDIDFSVQIFNFTADLVQRVSSTGLEDFSGTDYFVYRGGGGNETSFFTPDSTAQYSTEIIDATTQTGIHYIHADDSNYFDNTTMTRVIQITPAIADGFDVTQIVIDELPGGFAVENAVASGSTYTITNPTVESDGTIRVILSYTVPNTSSFDITLSATATYDPGSGVPTPALTSVTQEIERTVNITNVNSAADYVVDENTWVLANNPNANRIFTGTGDATVYGNAAADTVTSFDGNDTVYGRGGDDIIRTSSGDDYIDPGTGNNYVDGGDGVDTIDYSSKTANITLSVASPTLQTVVIGSETDQIANIENVTSGSGNDILTGSSGDNIIIGNNGNDRISGGLGNDRLEGGNGSDTIDYSYASGGITLDLGTADGNGDITLVVGAGDTDSINSFENIIGTGQSDVLTGDSGANDINGGGGNDTLASGGGADYLHGGGGTDTISYQASANSVNLDMTVTDANGYATVNFSDGTFEYVQSIEIFRDTAFGDTFIGDATDTYFYITDGADTIDGGGGTQDTIDYLYSGGSITLNLASSNAIDGGGATDTYSNIERFYTSNYQDTVYTSTGNDWVHTRNSNDTIHGSAGDDTIDGGTGTDTIDYSLAIGPMNINLNTGTVTGWGTDTLSNIESVIASTYDDLITLRNASGSVDGLGGIDTVNLSFASSSTMNMGSLNGSGYFTLTTNRTHTIRNVENFTGTSGVDDWRGDGNANIFDGAGGNDIFRYSLGNDIYIGGTGTNTLNYTGYTVGLTTNMSVLNGNGRIDITFDSIAKVDEFTQIQTFYGTDVDDDITGDSSANTIYGGSGADTIDGGAGADIIYDGAGADTINGGNDNDTIYADTANADNDSYDGGGGTGDVLSYSSATSPITFNIAGNNVSGASVGSDTIAGFEDYRGGSNADSFYGGASGEIMRGNDGNDVFYSSNGNDTIYGGNGTDTVDYTGEAGAITMNLSASTITKASGSDTLNTIETIEGTSHDDVFILNNYASLLNYNSIRGNGGTDEVRVTTTTTFDGVNLAAFFTEIEEIDFTASSLSGADTFDITGNDVKTLTDNADYLHITVNSGFTVNVASGSTYVLSGAPSTVGDTTTYTFDNGGDTVTLDVQTL